VLQAHVHDYERSWPMAHGAPSQRNYSSPAAPVYVVNGAAGNREDNDNPPGHAAWQPAADPAAGVQPWARNVSFGVITVRGDALTYEQFDSASGERIDTFTMTK
jgi:hypothetical protein